MPPKIDPKGAVRALMLGLGALISKPFRGSGQVVAPQRVLGAVWCGSRAGVEPKMTLACAPKNKLIITTARSQHRI